MSTGRAAERLAGFAMGSNLGRRRLNLRRGLTAIDGCARLERVSSLYASASVGAPDEPDYLNLVALAYTALAPLELLEITARTEAAQGRVRSTPNAARTLDIDILFVGDEVWSSDELTLPHPRWAERAFVLAPLAEIAPELRLPGATRTVGEIWRASHDRLPRVERLEGAAEWRGVEQ